MCMCLMLSHSWVMSAHGCTGGKGEKTRHTAHNGSYCVLKKQPQQICFGNTKVEFSLLLVEG